jgi:hypothetical protein
MIDPALLDALLKSYFRVARLENYPHTPELTKEADALESAIRKLKEQ